MLDNFTNTLYTNDNLFVLNGLNSNLVDLIYLDPPFNTKKIYSAPVGSKAAGTSFKDMWSWADVDEEYLANLDIRFSGLMDFVLGIGKIHSKAMMAYLTYMAQRIAEMHRVLKDTGSLYLHCDPTASHYLKLLLDLIFGKKNFQNEIVWCYRRWFAKTNRFQRMHDIIFYYSKTQEHKFNKLPLDSTTITLNKKIKLAQGYDTNKVKSGVNKVSQLIVYDKEKAKKKIESGKYDKIVYREEQNKTDLPDWWEIPYISSSSSERTGYRTQKPLALLNRIIKASSNEGDLVLDPFCGCATTCVAAQQLNRNWIGIDIELTAQLLVDRLSDDAGMFKDFVNTTIIPQRTDVTIELPLKSVKERLYKEQNCKCNGCDRDFELWDLEIDHIIPKSKNGGDYYENYQLLCSSCNKIKGSRPMEYLLSRIKRRAMEIEKIEY